MKRWRSSEVFLSLFCTSGLTRCFFCVSLLKGIWRHLHWTKESGQSGAWIRRQDLHLHLHLGNGSEVDRLRFQEILHQLLVLAGLSHCGCKCISLLSQHLIAKCSEWITAEVLYYKTFKISGRLNELGLQRATFLLYSNQISCGSAFQHFISNIKRWSFIIIIMLFELQIQSSDTVLFVLAWYFSICKFVCVHIFGLILITHTEK